MTLAQIIDHRLAMSDELHEYLYAYDEEPSSLYPTDDEIVGWCSQETSLVETLIEDMIGGE